MTNSIFKRIEIIEKALGGACQIPARERVIVVTYPDGDEQELERLTAESIAKLKTIYGPDISEEDLLIIGVRKFCSPTTTTEV